MSGNLNQNLQQGEAGQNPAAVAQQQQQQQRAQMEKAKA